MALPHSVSYLFFLYLSPFSTLCLFFYSILSNIDEVLSINPSDIVFLFGDFNIHHKVCLTYSCVTDRLVNFVITFLSRMTLFRWLTFLLRSMTVSLQFCSFGFISIFWRYNGFPPLGNSDHVVKSKFPLIFHQNQNGIPVMPWFLYEGNTDI